MTIEKAIERLREEYEKARAAEELGRKAIGFEVSTKYYKASIERMLNDAEIY